MIKSRILIFTTWLITVIPYSCNSQSQNEQEVIGTKESIKADELYRSEIKSKFDIDIKETLPFSTNEKIKLLYTSSEKAKWSQGGQNELEFLSSVEDSGKASIFFSATDSLLREQNFNDVIDNFSPMGQKALNNLVATEILFVDLFSIIENWNKTKLVVNNADQNCGTSMRIFDIQKVPVFISNINEHSKSFKETMDVGQTSMKKSFIDAFNLFYKNLVRVEKAMNISGLPQELRTIEGEEDLKKAKRRCIEVLEINDLEKLITDLRDQNIIEIGSKNIDLEQAFSQKDTDYLNEIQLLLK